MRKQCEDRKQRKLDDAEKQWIEEHYGRIFETARHKVDKWKVDRVIRAEDLACDAAIRLCRKRNHPKFTFSWLDHVLSLCLIDLLRVIDGRRGSCGWEVRRLSSRPMPRWYCFEDVVDDESDPVGLLLESEEEVCRLTRCLPRLHGAVLRSLLLDASTPTLKSAGSKHGVCESRASQLVAESFEMLRTSRRCHQSLESVA